MNRPAAQPALQPVRATVTYFFDANAQARRVAEILRATPAKVVMAFPVQNCIETDAPAGLVEAARSRAAHELEQEDRAANAIRERDAKCRLDVHDVVTGARAIEEQSCTELLGSAALILECAEMLSDQEQREQLLVDFKYRIRLALEALQAGRFTPESRPAGGSV